MVRGCAPDVGMNMTTKPVIALLLGLLMTLAGAALPARAAELVMFDDPGCVWCRKWLAEVGPGYPHSEEGQRAPLRRIDIKDHGRSGLTLRSRVTATPTFVLVDDGQEVGRITGYPGAENFYPMLDELLRKLPAPPAPKPNLREARLGAP